MYVYSTTASNAATSADSIRFSKELERLGYDVDRFVVFWENVEKAKRQILQTVEEKFQEIVNQDESAISALAKEQERQERATDIVKKMTEANVLFQDRRKAELFRLDEIEILEKLHTPCVDEADFRTKIASLKSLFDVPLDPLRVLVPNPQLIPDFEKLQSVKLTEEILKSEKVEFDPEMIKIWNNIITLRNAPPMHIGDQPIEAYKFFGVPYPVRDFQRLWDNILDRFRFSLDKFLKILFDLPKK